MISRVLACCWSLLYRGRWCRWKQVITEQQHNRSLELCFQSEEQSVYFMVCCTSRHTIKQSIYSPCLLIRVINLCLTQRLAHSETNSTSKMIFSLCTCITIATAACARVTDDGLSVWTSLTRARTINRAFLPTYLSDDGPLLNMR